MSKLLVNNSEIFKPRYIKEAILRETDCDEETADKITTSVVSTIYNNYDKSIDKTSIRTLINAQFIKRGMLKEEEQNRKLGLSVRDFEELIHKGCKDNANMLYNPEMIAKYCFDSIAKEDALLKQPAQCREAFEGYYIHEHDQESQELRSNCFNIDIRWIAKNGLDMDGNRTVATSKPAKSLYTLLRHMCEFFMASSCVFSGGLGHPYFNVFLAPYCKGMSYKDIKQSLQMFIFDVNQSLVSRGGQICFTSVGLEFKIPEWLRDVPAIAPAGVPIGTYKDYESEAELLLRAYIEIKMEGDSLGRPFRFPNDIFTLRDGVLDEYKGNIKLAHEYIAKFPTPYFLNSTHDERVAMGCLVGDTPIYVCIDGKSSVKTFKEISEMLDADYGFTKTDNIYVQSIGDNKIKDWFKAKGFIKNKDMKIYKVTLDDGRFFECDENHTMILPNLDRIKILDCLNEEVLMFDKSNDTLTTNKVIAIQDTGKIEDTYCFEVNDRIIIKDNILTGQCRTTNIDNWTGDKEKDLLNTGNFMYTSLNLPLIIMDNKDNWREAIKYYCDVSRDYLLYRKGQIEKRLYDDHLLDLLLSKDCETGEQLYDLDRLSYTIGYVGLNEAILTLTDGKEDILSNKELGKEILDIMNEKCNEYKEKDHLRWAVFSSPAESTAYKFGEYNKRKYPNAYVQGTKDHYYLTNSHHIRVSDTSNIIEHIRNGDYFHPLSLGGCIEHLWLGDNYIDPKSLFSLTKKIAKTNMNYWDYDTAFSSCSSCGFSQTEIFSECPICGSDDVITYDRCFSGDTFIYIKKGKIVKPVTLKDFVENYNVKEWEVPVFDYKTQSYVWSKVKRGIKNPPEEMINIKFSKGYEVTCTPNHEFYDYRTYKRKNNNYDTITANDLKIKSKIINHKCPKFLEDTPEDYLGTFIGFVLGDGHVKLPKNGKNVYIGFNFYKKEKSDYCKKILDKNNLEYNFSDDGVDKRNNSKIYSYYIGAKNVGNKAYDIFNMTHGDKRTIINECYNQDLLLGIFAGLINSDGNVLIESQKNNIVTRFYQVDENILWLFYNIALLLGTNPSIYFDDKGRDKPKGIVTLTSLKTYEILNKIILRFPFDKALEKGKCISDAKTVNGMCSVSAISEDVVQNSYCIETEHEGHNTLFNGILGLNCTGYYVPIKGFNKGKKQEFKDRYRHNLKKEKGNEL